jgi:hypothetical protein
MGAGGTLDRALGRPPVRRLGARRWLALAGAVLLLGGCHDVATIAALASASATGAATGNPAIGLAVGIGVSAGANFLVAYVTRVRAGAEQDVIAEAAGELPAGGAAPWQIEHTIPIGNEHGQVRVVDVLTTPIAVCKDVIISVAGDDADDGSVSHQDYLASICRNAQGWKWATAEPAVARWGAL